MQGVNASCSKVEKLDMVEKRTNGKLGKAVRCG